MRLKSARILSGVALALVAAVTSGCAPEPVMAPDTTAEDLTAINTLRGAWETAYEAGDASALAGLYTTDARVVVPGLPTVSGRAAVEEYYAGLLAQGTVAVDIQANATHVGGDIGYEMGTFSGTMTMADGTSSPSAGRYVVLLRRDTDGAWRIAGSGSNPDSVEGLERVLEQARAAGMSDMEGGGS